jgi:hypothetical protein
LIKAILAALSRFDCLIRPAGRGLDGTEPPPSYGSRNEFSLSSDPVEGNLRLAPAILRQQ